MTPASSKWLQMWSPQPSELQSDRCCSLPWQDTWSSQIGTLDWAPPNCDSITARPYWYPNSRQATWGKEQEWSIKNGNGKYNNMYTAGMKEPLIKVISIYRIAQLCGGGKYWWIWWIDSHLPLFYLPIFSLPYWIYSTGAYFYNFILERVLVSSDCWYTCPLKYR